MLELSQGRLKNALKAAYRSADDEENQKMLALQEVADLSRCCDGWLDHATEEHMKQQPWWCAHQLDDDLPVYTKEQHRADWSNFVDKRIADRTVAEYQRCLDSAHQENDDMLDRIEVLESEKRNLELKLERQQREERADLLWQNRAERAEAELADLEENFKAYRDSVHQDRVVEREWEDERGLKFFRDIDNQYGEGHGALWYFDAKEGVDQWMCLYVDEEDTAEAEQVVKVEPVDDGSDDYATVDWADLSMQRGEGGAVTWSLKQAPSKVWRGGCWQEQWR